MPQLLYANCMAYIYRTSGQTTANAFINVLFFLSCAAIKSFVILMNYDKLVKNTPKSFLMVINTYLKAALSEP